MNAKGALIRYRANIPLRALFVVGVLLLLGWGIGFSQIPHWVFALMIAIAMEVHALGFFLARAGLGDGVINTWWYDSQPLGEASPLFEALYCFGLIWIGGVLVMRMIVRLH